ncbi:MAG: MerC domain-containing protein [Bacteroidota bacterium]
MTTLAAQPRLDATGIFLSTLCFLHCLAVPLIATGALAWMASEAIHIGLTVVLSGIVLLVAWPSYKRHRNALVPALLVGGLALLIGAVLGEEALGEQGETLVTVAGSVLLILGHIVNLRAQRTRA